MTDTKKQVRQLQIRDLQKVFSLVCENVENIFLVIDALDECDENRHRKAVLGFLTGLEQREHVRALITSRSTPQDIQDELQSKPKIRIEAHDEDLRVFLAKKIEQSGNVDLIEDSFKTMLIESITSKAQRL